jgi:hypothetical protein
MPRLSIVLAEDELQALADLAIREWREPRDQAGYIITKELRRAGALPIEVTDYRAVEHVAGREPAEAVPA